MPPLPVLRAQLLGVLLAPASKLVRTLNEPGRSLAGVIKAYAEKATSQHRPRLSNEYPAAATEPCSNHSIDSYDRWQITDLTDNSIKCKEILQWLI